MAPPLDHAAEVRADLAFDVPEPTLLALHVALAGSIEGIEETFDAAPDSTGVEVVPLGGPKANRAHLVQTEPGRLTVTYTGTAAVGAVAPTPVEAAERLIALRQSRYCPSDLAEGFAAAELGHLRGDPFAAHQIGAWVHDRLLYEVGSTGPSETAIDTLLHGHGVCRDFAHLTITLCRALGIPARFVAVYAPGLFPMDFHAVAEVAGPEGWEIVDATRLAPRQSLVRIATGRDAADTALITTIEGHADLQESSVTAVVVDGDLPIDDHQRSISIA
jgi:transglutaminase-like putative cysteine protease